LQSESCNYGRRVHPAGRQPPSTMRVPGIQEGAAARAVQGQHLSTIRGKPTLLRASRPPEPSSRHMLTQDGRVGLFDADRM
jgi:hypothetical protein